MSNGSAHHFIIALGLLTAASALMASGARADTMPNWALLEGATLPSIPIFAGDPATQCTQTQFYDASGTLRSGTMVCAPPADCRFDAAVGCTATSDFPAINLALAKPANILANVTLGGVVGAAGAAPSLCAADGAVNCVTSAKFPSVDVASLPITSLQNTVSIGGVSGNFPTCTVDGSFGCIVSPPFAAGSTIGLSSKLGAGYTVAGVSGSQTTSAPACVADGATGCIATELYPAAKLTNFTAANFLAGTTMAGVSGSLATCTADGATACVSVSAYRAALTTGLAAKVLTGATVAGVAGSIAGAPAACASDGAVGCLATLALPAASVTGFNPALITAGTHIGGVSGTFAVCAADGASGCASSTAFPAAATSGLAAKVILGATVAGVSGTAVGASSQCSVDGQQSCVTVAGFPAAKLANFIAANVQSGISIGGVMGTYAVCAADGATGCIATAAYPAAYVSPSTIGGSDLRAGKTVGGITGALSAGCRNGITNSVFNYDGVVFSLPNSGATGGTINDSWDTIDDHGGFASSAVAGFAPSTLCDAAMWTDVTTTNAGSTTTTCAASPGNCQYLDTASNAVLSGILGGVGSPSSLTWNAAVAACAASTFGGYSAGTWRLPTQKELMSFYDRGLVSLAGASFITLTQLQGGFWTATTSSAAGTSAWVMALSDGSTSVATKTNTYKALCVR